MQLSVDRRCRLCGRHSVSPALLGQRIRFCRCAHGDSKHGMRSGFVGVARMGGGRCVPVRQRWPALRGPLRPCRVLWWDGWNLRTSQFFFVRRLKLGPPLLKFNVAHVERFIGRSCEPIGDTLALLLVVNRQVERLGYARRRRQRSSGALLVRLFPRIRSRRRRWCPAPRPACRAGPTCLQRGRAYLVGFDRQTARSATRLR